MIYWKEYDYNRISNYIKEDGLHIKKNGKESISYSNTIFTFDCETTSYFITPENEIMVFNNLYDNDFYRSCIKRGLMYIWMVGINEDVVYGRTYQEYREFEKKVKEITGNIRRIYYIHNLAFDFNFILNAFQDTGWEVFARDRHKVIYAINNAYDIELRCSYMLTGKSLDDFCKDYQLPVRKKVGELDYNVMRTPITELTEQELEYCEYDIKCLYEIIKYFKNKYKTIHNIPLTKTGIVRKPITHEFFKNKKYHDTIKQMSPKSFDELKIITDAYYGGYTHSNYLNTNQILEDILSYDITSSYPYECTTKKFPVTYFEEIDDNIEDINREFYAYIVDITFYDIESKTSNRFLPMGKHIYRDPITDESCPARGVEIDNNKVIKAKEIRYRLTDIDYDIVKETYNIKDYKINHLYIAGKDYLPYYFIQYILKLYKEKTQYKGIEDKVGLYQDAKTGVNAIYGMFVTKDIQDDVICNNLDYELWKVIPKTRQEITDELIAQRPKNTLYSWGVWVAAYGRKHLWNIINKLGDNVVYCDTDSVKFKRLEGFEKIFEEDNKEVIKYEEAVCKRFKSKGLTMDDYKPKDIHGKEHQLGLFDKEKTYKRFKTIGAKKYAYEYEDGKVHITVAGINKKKGAEALKCLEDFEIGKFFDYDDCGKLEVYYFEDQLNTVMPDGYVDDTKYGVCLKPTTYTLDITADYSEILHSGIGLSAL